MSIRVLSACILILALVAIPAATAQTVEVDLTKAAVTLHKEKSVGLVVRSGVGTWSLDSTNPEAGIPVHLYDDRASEPRSETAPATDGVGLVDTRVPLTPRAPAVPELPRLIPPALPLGAGLDLPLSLDVLDDAPPAAPAVVEPPAPVAPAAAVIAPEPPLAAAAATSAALVAVAAASAAAPALSLGWERLRRFAVIASLYTRIAKERLLDHGSRETLLATIRERPGLPVTDLAALANVPRNTATYHLRRLEREGIVMSQRDGRVRLWFSVGGTARKDEAPAFAALRHDTTRAIAREVAATPGMDQQALCARFGIAPSLAHWHADRLVASGLVRKERDGRRVRYYPTEGLPRFSAFSA